MNTTFYLSTTFFTRTNNDLTNNDIDCGCKNGYNSITVGCGYSSVAEHRLPKPVMRVRFPLSAPSFGAIAQLGERYLDMVEVSQVRSLFAPPSLSPVPGVIFLYAAWGGEEMFVIYEKKRQRVPIKIWLENRAQVEEGCLEQALNLANLPFAYKWVALMPDVHKGYGMPIGGVIAVEDAVIPNAVGVDIGCGVAFVETSVHKDRLKAEEYKALVGQIMRDIPTGFNHHTKKQECKTLNRSDFAGELSKRKVPEGLPQIEEGYYQIGTLGGGNHFIELQEDEGGKLCIMVHSGSRNFGYKVARFFNDRAEKLNEKLSSGVPEGYELAFLPIETGPAASYVSWMKLALDFASENRQVMLEVVKDRLSKRIPGIEFGNVVNAHHNYAALEHHYGKNVWVHRKGAIRAGEGDIGIIPGAMGSYSYIVRGRGNPESFCSCSHGAGRKMGRRQAKKQFAVQKTVLDLKERGVILGKRKKADVSEECRFAYKDIDFVISQQLDLIEPVKKLKTVAVIKG